MTTHTHTHTHTHAEKEEVFEVKVEDVSCIYQAGSNLLFLRILQGSAVITTETQNGEEKWRMCIKALLSYTWS